MMTPTVSTHLTGGELLVEGPALANLVVVVVVGEVRVRVDVTLILCHRESGLITSDFPLSLYTGKTSSDVTHT